MHHAAAAFTERWLVRSDGTAAQHDRFERPYGAGVRRYVMGLSQCSTGLDAEQGFVVSADAADTRPQTDES